MQVKVLHRRVICQLLYKENQTDEHETCEPRSVQPQEAKVEANLFSKVCNNLRVVGIVNCLHDKNRL